MTTCHCGSSADPDHIELAKAFPRIIGQPLCIDCGEKRNEAAQAKADQIKRDIEAERRETRWRTTVGANYRNTDTAHPEFNRDLLAKVADWKPGPRWLGLVGDPGASKTRVAALIAKRCIFDLGSIVTWTTLPNIQTMTDFIRLGTELEKQDALHFLRHCRKADLLVMDDFGKNTWNDSVERAVFEIVDHRAANFLPVIWTANTHPMELLPRLSKDRGNPILGRIIENSRVEYA